MIRTSECQLSISMAAAEKRQQIFSLFVGIKASELDVLPQSSHFKRYNRLRAKICSIMNYRVNLACLVVMSCALAVSAGTSYNDNSVCQCLARDFKTYPCLCKDNPQHQQNYLVQSSMQQGKIETGSVFKSPYTSSYVGQPYGHDTVDHASPYQNHNRPHHHNHHRHY